MNPLLAKRLQTHDFRELFIEELGWDHADNCIEFEISQRPIKYQVIAHKRGFAVLVGKQHRTVLADRHFLRRIQKQIARVHHEHIVIHFSDNPFKQVWQWAIRTPDGRKFRHREHPFYSNEPPEKLLNRIEKLGFSLDEEESITLVDALDRVRQVLDRPNENDLFAKRPWYARESDKLAMAMKRGEPGAFDAFVEFHMPLARRASRMVRHWFPHSNADDAEQIAMIGLIKAASRFKPELGAQFSTYASYWIRQCCQRYAPDVELPIRLPANVFWQYYRARYDLFRLIATHGTRVGERRFAKLHLKDKTARFHWRGFNVSFETRTLTDIHREEFFEIRRRCDPAQMLPIVILQNREFCQLVSEALSELPERDAYVLELRYGIGCPEHTLEEAGQILKITRERVRQIQDRAEKKLLWKLAPREFDIFGNVNQVSNDNDVSELKEENSETSNHQKDDVKSSPHSLEVMQQ